LRETLTRVLRTYGLTRGEDAAGSLPVSATTSAKADCDFDAEAWDRGEQLALIASGIGRVVMNRLPVMGASLAPVAGMVQPLWRVVVDLPDDTGSTALAALHRRGVRGLRFAIGCDGLDGLDQILRLADRVVSLGWHIELDVASPGAARALAKAEWRLMQLPLAVCFSGLGAFRQGRRADDADLQFLFGMVQLGRFWLKVSGDDLTPPQLKLWDEPSTLARALSSVRKDRLIWGSGRHGGGDIATHVAAGLATLEKAVPHPADREQILVDNPARLYAFDSADAA
jgi:predicted TIM-barrel fold metal-dependent hydrolase